MSARIALVGLEEVPTIAAVIAAAFDPRYGEGWSGAQVTGALGIPDTWAQLARDGNRALGFTLTRRIGDEAELMMAGVVPEARGHGLGRRLIDAAAHEAQRRGAAAMFLEVRDNNAAALALYRAAGFRIVGRRPNYYKGALGERFDALTLRRNLP